jgi:hypothetical protein
LNGADKINMNYIRGIKSSLTVNTIDSEGKGKPFEIYLANAVTVLF